jgi:hypothetical protein
MQDQSPGSIESDRHFQLLLADYQSGREDDRTLLTVQSAGVGVVITLIGLLSAMTMQACAFQENPKDSECADLPHLMLAGAPLIPTATAAFLLMLGALSTVRNYYLRAVERQLHEYVNRPFERMDGTAPGPGMYMTVTTELTSLRRGRFSHRLLARLVVVSAAVAFMGITIYIMLNVNFKVQILMIAFYGPLFALVVYEYIAAGLGGRSLFTKAVLAAASRAGNPDYLPTVEEFRKRSRQRSILSYLVYPRPEDWSKLFNSLALYVPVALFVGDFSRLLDFAALVLVLELLIYQARYQLNDVRDAAIDRTHAESHARGRLPQGDDLSTNRQYLHWSLAVALLRILGAVGIGFFYLPEALWLLLAVAVATCCYEALRSKTSRELVSGPTVHVAAIWLTAGLGYAVRGALAIALAGVPLSSATGIAGIAFYYSLGVMFVLLPWVLDAASYCHVDIHGKWVFQKELIAKPHLSVLLNYVRRLDRMESWKNIPVDRIGAHERVLKNGERFWTPWNLMFFIAAGFGGALGSLLYTGGEALPSLTLLAAGVGAGSAVLVAAARPGAMQKVAYLAGAVALAGTPYAWSLMGGTVYAGPEWLPSGLAGLTVLLPWIMFWLFYVAIVEKSYHDLKYSLQRIITGLMGGAAHVLRLLIGKSTWQALGYHDALGSWRSRLVPEPGARAGAKKAGKP